MSKAPELSVVIPAYNEAARIGTTLSTLAAYLESRGDTFEILVVDDGSNDATAQLTEAFGDGRIRCLTGAANRGKGAAVRRGLAAARGARVLITDADLSTPIPELAKLEPHLATAEIVIGSRAADDSSIHDRQPAIRELLGKTFNLLLRLLALTPFRDTQCGFKLLDGDAARELAGTLTINGFAYDVELLHNARRRGLRIAEVGVQWSHSDPSSVPLLGAGSGMVADACRLRWRTSTPGARLAGAVTITAAGLALALQIAAIHAHSLSGDGTYHLVAGHQALRYGNNTTNLEHPPLAKLAFALPTLLEDAPLAPPIVVAEAIATCARVHATPERLRRVWIRARYVALFCFVLPLLAACYTLGERAGGVQSGIILTLTLALSFSVAGNLTVLQTDVAVSLAFVLTVLAAHAYVGRPRPAGAALLGAAWGLGLSVKFSAVLLGPTVLLALLLARRSAKPPLRRVARDALLAAAVAIALLHLAYAAANVEYSSEAGRATILDYIGGRGTMVVDGALGRAEPALLAVERFDPYLAQWLTGLLAVNAHNTIGVYPSYAFGEVSSAGHWWYHPAVFLLKTPLAWLAAALATLGTWTWRRRGGAAAGAWRPSVLGQLGLLTVGVYLTVAMSSSYNLGFRHLLPVLPFIYLPVARAVAASRVAGTVLLLVLAAESLAVAPLWASQSNTWWLGEHNPTRFSLSHGNLDFGQNYLQLARAVERRDLGDIGVVDPRLHPLALKSYLGAEARLVRPGDALPAGWYVVHVLIEQLVPALLREDVGYVYDLESLQEQARLWRPLWDAIATGEDHGYIAGTYHLYRLTDR
jgi:hypothetical protein